MFHRLPEQFTAEDIGRTGITGSRRHMMVRHFAEHPSFACSIDSRNPLTVGKSEDHGSPSDHSEVVAD